MCVLIYVQVRVVASMPCYSKDNVDAQRGGGVFRRSIKGLQMLNAAGYGQPGSDLILDLVYNPSGGFLAPSQVRSSFFLHIYIIVFFPLSAVFTLGRFHYTLGRFYR